MINCAAGLAYHRLLGSEQVMVLRNVDLTSVPTEHLASLASSVTGIVSINNLCGCNLVTILDSVKSQVLLIRSQSLVSEETRALVRAMETGVKIVRLYREVTLDIRDLMGYSGHGKCREVVCYRARDTADRYREKLRTWATSKNWEMICDGGDCFVVRRFH